MVHSFGEIRISDPRSVWIMVHQGNQWTYFGHRYIDSFIMYHDPDTSWITDPVPHHLIGMHPWMCFSESFRQKSDLCMNCPPGWKKVAVIERSSQWRFDCTWGMSPLRWLTRLEVKIYEWWPSFLRVVGTISRSKVNVKITFPMAKA